MPQVVITLTAPNGVTGFGRVRQETGKYGVPHAMPGQISAPFTPGNHRFSWQLVGPPGEVAITVFQGATELASDSDAIGADGSTNGYVKFEVA